MDSNAAQVGNEGADALERLRTSIQGNREAIRGYAGALAALKGDTAAITTAREKLRAKIDAEKAALSSNTLAVVKAGTSYDALTAAQKKLTLASQATTKSITAAGGPVAAVRDKLATFREAMSTAEGRSALLARGAVALGAALSVAVVAGALAAGAAIVALTAKFLSFVLASGNTLRSQQLTRSAFLASSEDAERLGHQIESLGAKVPLARSELNTMGNELARAGLKGKVLVDTLNATAQAQSALGGDAGNRISELVSRNRLTGRFALGQLDTQGLGVSFGDVAEALAKNTKSSIQDAATALMQGQVTIGDGAAALKDAVERRFKGVNLAKLLDFDVIKTKLGDFAEQLVSGIDFGPITDDARSFLEMLSPNSQTGASLKEFVTFLGGGLVDAVHRAFPVAKEFLELMVLKGLQLELSYLKLKIAFLDAFGDDSLDALDGLTVDVGLLTSGVDNVSIALDGWRRGLQTITEIRTQIESAEDAVNRFASRFAAMNPEWAGIGSAIVEGLIGPMTSLPDRFGDISDKALKAVKASWGIASPSKEARDMSRNIVRGSQGGAEDERGALVSSLARSFSPVAIASSSAAAGLGVGGAGGSAGGGGGDVQLVVNYHAAGGRDARAEADELAALLAERLNILRAQRGLGA